MRRPSAHGVGRPLAIIFLALAGCDAPNYQGPQIQEVPPGFLRQPDSYLQRRMFPDREVVHHDGWVNTSFGHVSMIYINGHPGPVSRADVVQAQNGVRAVAVEPITFGDIEEYMIDGHPAWGWTERLETRERGLVSIAFRVAIPYDSVTYAIELESGDPYFKGVQDTLVHIAQTFAVGETTWNIPLIVVIGVAVFVFIMWLKGRRQKKRERMQNIRFVKIEMEEKEEDRTEYVIDDIEAPMEDEPGGEPPER